MQHLLVVLLCMAALHSVDSQHAAHSRRARQPRDLTRLSDERVVFQTSHGDIEFAFLPEVAPVTVAHIFKLVVLGAYQGNHIFRVDKNFVAQVADVQSGRTYPMNKEQEAEAKKTVPLEIKHGINHTPGVLSMGRYDDPDSGASSFSFLLGDAPHLDSKYTIFGNMTRGLDTLHKLEELETRTEGIFVMPKERVTIHSTYWYLASGPITVDMHEGIAAPRFNASMMHLQEQLASLQSRFNWQAEELQRVRRKCLPGR